MESTYTEQKEMRYYRNLLSLNVGDTIEWNLNQNNPSSPRMRGRIIAIYPEGASPYTGKRHAFLTVFAFHPIQNYSVSLTNPTIRKLETDK